VRPLTSEELKQLRQSVLINTADVRDVTE